MWTVVLDLAQKKLGVELKWEIIKILSFDTCLLSQTLREILSYNEEDVYETLLY